MSLEHELEVAKELALIAGDAVRSYCSRTPHIMTGAHIGTIPDLIADDIIVSGLQRAFPHDALCSEQTPISSGRFECDRLWLVDALDGAADLAQQGSEYAVSIGLVVRGQAVLGVVYNPARGELFTGASTLPVTINGSATKPRDTIAGARIGIPSSEWVFTSDLPEFQSVHPIVSTAYGLARVAAGMDDGFFSVQPVREWSTCAGAALVCAARGRITLPGMHGMAYNSCNLTHPFGIIAIGCDVHASLDQSLTKISRRLSRPAA